MKSLMWVLLGTAALVASGSAAAQDSAVPQAPTEAQALIANCDAHKFETTIQTSVDGKPRQSKVKLCGEDGQTDAEWLTTLRDALDKVDANPKMSAEVKTQIAAGLKSEIAKVEAGIGAGHATIVAPAPVPVAVAPPPVSAPAASPFRPVVSKAAPPRLSIECYTPGDIGAGGPCVFLTRETRVTVHAKSAVPTGAGLRFVYKGDARGELALPAIRAGEARRIKLPPQVCSGGGTSRIAIEVRGPGPGNAVGDTFGPFTLRC